MLPKVLLTIINNYNEVGIFIHWYDTVCWFNGLRFEKWFRFAASSLLRVLNNKIYLYDSSRSLVLNRNSFIESNQKFEYDHRLRCIINKKLYIYNSYTCELRTRNEISVKKPNSSGAHIIAYKHFIYCFSYCGFQNDKYCTITNQWTSFARSYIENNIANIFLLNDLFYAYTNFDPFLHIYDPQTDVWKESTHTIKEKKGF